MTKNISVSPYLNLGDSCEEAINFYQEAIGAQVDMVMRFNESPDPIPTEQQFPGYENKIMHATLRIGSSIIMMSYGCYNQDNTYSGISLSIALDSQLEAEKIFSALSESGKITMPLTKTFWSPCFGMVQDKFGVDWMINAISSNVSS